MRIELIPGLDNVIRFPVERRVPASLELLREIAPDVREVLNVAEAFGLEAPDHDLYQQADQTTAERIHDQVPPEPSSQRRRMLAEMRQDVITEAVAACRTAQNASMAANEAHQRLLAAQTARGWRGELDHLGKRADRVTEEAAERLVLAHVRVQQALGAVRAIDLARRGETWTPRSAEADTLWLLEQAG